MIFHQSCSDAIIVYDNMLASALDKVVTFASEVLFETTPTLPTLSKLESTPGDRIGLRISGQPEETYTLNENEANVSLTSSLMQQVLKSPRKSTMINDLINYPSLKKAEKSVTTTLYHIEIQKLMPST